MFPETCQAWVHGPVYPVVYDLFRDFKYNPIEDARFAIFNGIEDNLTADEHLTHSESPWKAARAGYSDGIPSHEPIPDENIKSYFQAMNEKYDFSYESGIKHYINDILQ